MFDDLSGRAVRPTLKSPRAVLALLSLTALCAGCPDDGARSGGKATPPSTGPWAKIEWPADGSAHNTVRLDVRGRARNLTAVFVNSDRVDVAADGTWLVDLELPEGEGEIRVVAPPPPGGGAEPTLLDAARVSVDLRAPVLLLTELPGSAHPYRKNVQIVGEGTELVGTITDEWPGVIAELTLDDVPQTITNGTFRAELALEADGEHTATLVVKDAAGNQTRLKVPLVRDTVPPTLRIDQRVELPGGALRIRGAVVDANPTALYADGETVPLEPDGSFLLDLAADDESRVQLLAEDAAGQISEELFVER